MIIPLLISTCNADIMGITLGKTTLSSLEHKFTFVARSSNCKKNTKHWDCNNPNNTYSTKYLLFSYDNKYYPIVEVENDTNQVIRVLLSFQEFETNVDNCGNKGSSFTMNEFLSANIFNVPQQNFEQISTDNCLKTYGAKDNLSNYIGVYTNGNDQLISIYYTLPETVIQERIKNSKIKTLKELGTFK